MQTSHISVLVRVGPLLEPAQVPETSWSKHRSISHEGDERFRKERVFENPRDKIHIARVDCTVVISPKHARPTAKEAFCPQLRKTNRYLDRNVNPKQVVRQLLIKKGVQEDTSERSTGDRRTSPSFE
jgi:hypothetical protein